MIETFEYLQHFQRPVEIFKEHVNTGLAGLTIRGLLNAYIPLDVRDSKVDIPVFANIRSHFSKGKFAPFADLKGGTYITNGGGLYVIASVGIRYALNDKQGLSLSLGYTNEKLEFEVFDGFIGYDSMDYTRDKKQYNTEAVAIKLGFDF